MCIKCTKIMYFGEMSWYVLLLHSGTHRFHIGSFNPVHNFIFTLSIPFFLSFWVFFSPSSVPYNLKVCNTLWSLFEIKRISHRNYQQEDHVAFIPLLHWVMISWFQEQEIKILVRGFAPFLAQQGPCAQAQSRPRSSRSTGSVVLWSFNQR